MTAQWRDQSRRPMCTHMTMTRLYGPYKCLVCRTYPVEGWVYMCTQDHPNMWVTLHFTMKTES